jgi:cbb3-type cytochrome oxidase subunit 3
MRRLPISLLRQNKAVSTAISALIITAATATLVMAVAAYAYYVLEQQRGGAEFEVAKKSILAFDDALQDAAWKLNASRAVRFKIGVGNLLLIPSAITLNLTATIDSSDYTLESISTGVIKYSISTQYVSFGENYTSYILGDSDLVVTDSAESLGKVFIEQESPSVNIILNYRVRAMRTSYLNVNGTMVNYVSVWLIRVVTNSASHINDFDLKAKSLSIQTNTIDPGVSVTSNCTISVESDSESSSATISLDPGKVVFSVIVAEVKVSV